MLRVLFFQLQTIDALKAMLIDNTDYNEDTYAECWVSFFFCWNIVIFDIKFGFNVEKSYICGDIVHFTMHSTGWMSLG